jgi:hypothetical protein
MNALLALALTLTQTWELPTPTQSISGPVTRYDDGLMAQVLVNRNILTDTILYGAWLAANKYDGVLSLEHKGDIGRTVWIGSERFFVGDCRQLLHYPGEFAVEVDWRTAERWKARGPWPSSVTAWFEPLTASRWPGLVQ